MFYCCCVPPAYAAGPITVGVVKCVYIYIVTRTRYELWDWETGFVTNCSVEVSGNALHVKISGCAR